MYIIMLIVGFGFLLVTAFAGELFDLDGTSFSVLRPSTLALFLAVTGALGLFLSASLWSAFVAPIAFGGGALTAFFIDKFVWQPLFKAQNTSTKSQSDLIGLQAVVDSAILENGAGRIFYLVEGSKVTSPARGMQGERIENGTTVKIERIENHVFIVRPWAEEDAVKEVINMLENQQ